ELLRRAYRIEVEGGEHIPATGPCILVSNHDSLADPFFLGVATPRPIHYMSKIELWNNPIVGKLMDWFGTFPIERGGGDSGALRHGLELLEEGGVLGIFPQGTSRAHRNRPFLRGAARLALLTGAPIVPVCLVNTEKALRPSKPRIGFPKIKILVGRPRTFEPQRPTVASARAMTRELEEAIEELRRPYGPPDHVWLD
nr:1-acyl-sn-glycerol-3-phosphate acyltransferase [Actinomycetota bacterium]